MVIAWEAIQNWKGEGKQERQQLGAMTERSKTACTQIQQHAALAGWFTVPEL